MPPSRNPFRTPPSSGSYARSRKRTKSTPRSMKRIAPFKIRSQVAAKRVKVQTGSSRTVDIRVKGKRKVYKPKRKVRITRKFSRMVGKVLEGKTKKGFFQKTWMGRWAIPNQGLQTVQGPATQFDIGLHFAPNQIMDATSVLWNKKPLSAAIPQMQDNGNFDRFATKVYIRKLWSVYEFKSNSQRTHYMKFFVCRPRIAAPSIAPSDHWVQLLADMTSQGINVNNTGVTTPHADPRSLDQWNKYWACEVTTITLEPGQTFKKVVKGPEEMTYDFAKQYQSTIGEPVDAATPASIKLSQPTARWVFIIHMGEIAGTVTAGVDRANTGPVSLNAPGILYERNDYYSLSVPENAGFLVPVSLVTGNSQPLTQVRDAYCIYNTDIGDDDGALAPRVDELNPQAPQTAPLG